MKTTILRALLHVVTTACPTVLRAGEAAIRLYAAQYGSIHSFTFLNLHIFYTDVYDTYSYRYTRRGHLAPHPKGGAVYRGIGRVLAPVRQ